jgi:hypothetical protein
MREGDFLMREPFALTGGELSGCPGWWKIDVVIEDESALQTVSAVRQPGGIYREVVREDYFLGIEIGDEIPDRTARDQWEEYYSQLRHKAEESVP